MHTNTENLRDEGRKSFLKENVRIRLLGFSDLRREKRKLCTKKHKWMGIIFKNGNNIKFVMNIIFYGPVSK